MTRQFQDLSDQSPLPSQEMAEVFSALSNPARIDILKHIACHNRCGCKDITQILPLAQSTVSQHLKVLIEAGLIIAEQDHPRSRYRLNEQLLIEISGMTTRFMQACCNSEELNSSPESQN